MNVDLKQEKFSHCRCQTCGHFAKEASFNPRIVPLGESNIPTITWTVHPQEPGVGIELTTINYNCPICNSPYIEPFFTTELQ